MKESLLTEAQTLLDAIDNPSMKEVKGLEDRLYGLEQLMFGAKKIVQEQGDMAQVGIYSHCLLRRAIARARHDAPKKYLRRAFFSAPSTVKITRYFKVYYQ